MFKINRQILHLTSDLLDLARLFLRRICAKIMVLPGNSASFIDDLDRDLHAWQTVKSSAEDSMLSNHTMDRLFQYGALNHTIKCYRTIGAIAILPLPDRTQTELLWRELKAFNTRLHVFPPRLLFQVI